LLINFQIGLIQAQLKGLAENGLESTLGAHTCLMVQGMESMNCHLAHDPSLYCITRI